MRQKRYAQLLNTAVAIQATATFINSQVSDFATKFKSGFTELSSALDCVEDSLKHASNDPLDPNLPENVKNALDRKQQELKIFERPALLYQKEIARLANTVEARIAPELLRPCAFDINKIIDVLEQTRPLLANSKQTINSCLAETYACFERIAAMHRQNTNVFKPPSRSPRM